MLEPSLIITHDWMPDGHKWSVLVNQLQYDGQWVCICFILKHWMVSRAGLRQLRITVHVEGRHVGLAQPSFHMQLVEKLVEKQNKNIEVFGTKEATITVQFN